MRTARILVVLVLSACSSQTSAPTVDELGPTGPLPAAGYRDAAAPAPSHDAGAPSDAETMSSGSTKLDGQQCALFVPSGIDVAETRVAGSPPLPMGGPLMLGYYELVAVRVYTGKGGATGPTGRTLEETMLLDALDFQDVRVAVQGKSAAFGEPVVSAGTFRNDGLTLTFAMTCPSSSTVSVPFATDGRTLHLYEGATEHELQLR